MPRSVHGHLIKRGVVPLPSFGNKSYFLKKNYFYTNILNSLGHD